MEFGSKAGESDVGVGQLYRRIFSYIYPYRFRFALGLATALLAGASTGTLYVALKTVTALVLRGTADFSVTVPVLGKLDLSQILGFKQWLALGDNWQTTGKIAALCLIVPCFVLLRGILDFLTSYQLAWIEQRVTLDLRRKVFSRIMDRS